MIRGEDIWIGYNKKVVLKDLNFNIYKGINGFLGANGVGKSTFFKLIIGEIKAKKGKLTIDRSGDNLNIGYLPQNFMGYPEMKVGEFLEYMAMLKSLNVSDNIKKEVENKIRIFSIDKLYNKKLKKLSGGQLRRVGLAQAMLFDPEIILLDEPTTGLDPNERIRFRKYISSIGQKSIVLLSTHIVSDLMGVANYIFILKNNRFFLEGTEDDILKKCDLKAYIYTSNKIDKIKEIEKNFLVSNIHHDNGIYTVRFLTKSMPDIEAIEEPLNLEDIYYANFSEELKNEV